MIYKGLRYSHKSIQFKSYVFKNLLVSIKIFINKMELVNYNNNNNVYFK